VWFTGFRNHEIIAEADGELYQTMEQSQAGPIIYAFRDPFAFRNPDDDKTYILFEGNTAGVAGEYECQARDLGHLPPGHTVPADSRFYTGNIGLMEATNSNLRRWQLLPPILSANCVNQQTERPHLVFRDGRVLLFTISHTFTFAPGLTGPDGVYGFVGDSVRSDYRPLNASALVLGNPPEQPLQQYSHYVMPNLLVESFIDTIFTQPNQQAPVYGGTLAPTLRLAVEDQNTYVVEQLGYGYIPATQQTRAQQVGTS
jgi:levansucrase